MTKTRINDTRRGFSLLELILALALSGLILFAVGMAIDLHLRVLSVRRTHVEEAQVARAVLRMIADDLRGAVRRVEMDTSSVQLPDVEIPEELEGFDEESLTGEEEEDSSEIADTVIPPPVPGLYGNMLEIQVDVSRLPRLDEFQSMMAPDAMAAATDIPSDLKTVSYYVAPADPSATSLNASGGLVRRVLDRAVMQYAGSFGDLSIADASAQVIAPEVTSIQFQYFDGVGWYPEWDSDALGGLPLAVEIVITVAPLDMVTINQFTTATVDPTQVDLQQRTYRLVVRLPAAEPILPEEESTTTDTTTETGL